TVIKELPERSKESVVRCRNSVVRCHVRYLDRGAIHLDTVIGQQFSCKVIPDWLRNGIGHCRIINGVFDCLNERSDGLIFSLYGIYCSKGVSGIAGMLESGNDGSGVFKRLINDEIGNESGFTVDDAALILIVVICGVAGHAGRRGRHAAGAFHPMSVGHVEKLFPRGAPLLASFNNVVVSAIHRSQSVMQYRAAQSKLYSLRVLVIKI